MIMKKQLILFVALLLCVSANAQETEGYLLTQSNVSVQYSYTYGGKLMGYLLNTLQKKETVGNSTTYTYLLTMLNKKEKPSKNASFMGLGDGYQSQIIADNGAYVMTQDLCIANGGTDRHGFILKMPSTLKVGDAIECGKLELSLKFPMMPTTHNNLTYSDFKVVEEVDLQTQAGTYHCLKITGIVTGEYQKIKLNDHQVWYIAKGIGIVRQESYYMGEKKPIIIELYKVNNNS